MIFPICSQPVIRLNTWCLILLGRVVEVFTAKRAIAVQTWAGAVFGAAA
jgi:hypothetical protein